MESLKFVNNLYDLNIMIKLIKLFFIVLFSYYIFSRIINLKKCNTRNMIIMLLSAVIISIIVLFIEYEVNTYCSLCLLVLLITLINTIIHKKDYSFNLLITIISLSINYIIYIISLIIAFIPCSMCKINNNYIELIIIICIYFFNIIMMFKLKKFKYGVSFFIKKLENSYYNLLILNISSLILFLIIVLKDKSVIENKKMITTLAVLSAIMFLTIKQSFSLYYKQNLLEKDFEQTKAELESKKKEIKKLEEENLEFNKTSHSLAHKQKSLEHKLEQLMKTGLDARSKEGIKQEIQNISKEVYKEPKQMELPKTEIKLIDDMFSYMQSECIKDNIKFELQVVGNVFYMINHLISENELEILLADHIKDAIIAINHSDNTNRSILVRIGKIDNVYSLYIYDSGIEFKKEVLDNLGKKPITTHADSGGTGMGFMNTFDTLNRTKASLIINEIGKPCIDNYTKVLIFKFDNKNEFIVNSYKNEVVVV